MPSFRSLALHSSAIDRTSTQNCVRVPHRMVSGFAYTVEESSDCPHNALSIQTRVINGTAKVFYEESMRIQ
jgi:hypothetical protein